MDALIRSARLAPARTRLSENRKVGAQASGNGSTGEPLRSAQEMWREELERQIRGEIESQAQRLYQSERDRGYADGHADGLAEARDEAAKDLERIHDGLRARLDSVLAALEKTHQAIVSNVQASVGEVAFAAVCRLVGRKELSHAVVLQVVEHACTQLHMETGATIRLHPRDVETVTELLRHDGSRVQALGLKLVSDESLQLGGCVVEGNSGQYDGGLESQLRRLHAILTSDIAVADRAGEGA
jgi:flagellar assembly protein FliH